MTIRKKLLLGLTISLLIVLAMGLLVYGVFQAMVGHAEEVEDAFRQGDAVAELQLAIERAITAPNRYLITGDPAQRERFNALAAEVEDRFSALTVLLGETEEGRTLLADTGIKWQQAHALAAAILALPNPASSPETSTRRAGNAEGVRLMEQMDALVRELITDFTDLHQQQQAQVAAAVAAARATEARVGMALLLAIALILASRAAFASYLSHALVRPLTILIRTAEALGRGELGARAAVEGDDELARLARAFNAMADVLQRRLTELQALTIEKQRLNEALEARVDQAAALTGIVQALNASRDMHQVFQAVAKELGRLVPFDRASIALVDDPQAPTCFTMHVLADRPGAPLGPGQTLPLSATTAAASVLAGQPHRTDDLATELDFAGERLLYEGGYRSRLNLPLIVEGQVIGALNLASTQPAAFAGVDLAPLEQVAGALAAALSQTELQSRLEANLERRTAEAEALNAIAVAAVTAPDLETVLETALDRLLRVLDLEAGGVLLPAGEDSEALHLVAHRGLPAPFIKAVAHLPADISFTGRVYRSGEPVILEDITAHAPERTLPIVHEIGLRAFASVPLRFRGRVVGVLNVGSRERRSFFPEDLVFLTAAGDQLGSAVENARLHEAVRKELAERQRVERVLRESEERFRTLFESQTDTVVLLDTEFRHVAVNHPLVGKTPEELIGRTIYETLPPDLLEQRVPQLQQVLETGQPLRAETSFIGPAGKPICIDTILTPHRSSEGEILGIISQSRDITARKQAEEEARRRHQELAALNTIAAAMSESLDLDTILKAALGQIVRFTGVDGAECHLADDPGTLTLATTWGLDEAFVAASHDLRFAVGEGIPGRALASRAPVYVADAPTDERYLRRDLARAAGYRSLLCVPIPGHESLLGTFMLYTHEPREFASDVQELLMTIGGQLAVAIERARLYERVKQQRIEEQETLLRLSQTLIGLTDPQAVMDATASTVQEALQPEYVSLMTPDPTGRWLVLVGGAGWEPELYGQYRVEVETSREGYVFRSGEPVQQPDVQSGEPFPCPIELRERGVVSSITVPLRGEGGTLGTLCAHTTRPRQFSPDEVRFLTLIANQAATATEKARLYKETRRWTAHLEALNAIITAASAAQNLPDLLEIALDRTLQALGLEMGAIWVGNQRAVRGLPAEICPAIAQTAQIAGLEILGPIAVEDWEEGVVGSPAPRNLPNILLAFGPLIARFGFRSSLTVPILAEGRPLGGLTVTAPQPRPWSVEEVTLVEGVGRQLGGSAERLRLFEEIHTHAERMARLASLSEALNHPLTLGEVVAAVGRGVLTLSDSKRAAVYVRHPDDTVSCSWSQGLSPEYVAQVTAHWREMPGGRVFESTEPVLIPDVARLSEESALRNLAVAEGYRAVDLWPLVYEGQVVASMGCYHDAPHTWSEAEQEVMQTFARQAAVALENAKLYDAERTRRQELSALYDLSRKLVATDAMETVLNTIARHTAAAIHVTFCRILMREDGLLVCRATYPVRLLERELGVGQPDAEAAWPHYQRALIQAEPRVLSQNDPEFSAAERQALFLDLAQSLCLAPLRVGDEAIGLLVLGEARSIAREPFDADKLHLIASIADQAASALHRARLHEELEEAYVQTVLALANTMDARDSYTADHSQRLAAWAEAAAQELGCSEEGIQAIRWAALLHDIGKIGVPDEILRKPGPLTDEEWDIMKLHPEIGAQIVAPVKKLIAVAPIIRAHQEHWDGTGYPDGLQGEAIPLGARVLAVVDAYGAMTDDRVYRKARSHEEAVGELRRCAGTQFDPQVVEAFLRVLAEGIGGLDG